MREILFRGKRVDNGKWVYGYYIKATHHWHNHGIHEDWIAVHTIQNGGWCNVMGKYAVLPETVGQFTGLTDRNGKKIFEGDIVKALVIYNERFQDSVKKVESVYEIKYHKKYCYFYLARKNINVLFDGNWNYGVTGYEVIGNIHDNPELVRGEEE